MKNTLLSLGLGRPAVKHAHSPVKIIKHYSLNKSYVSDTSVERTKEQMEQFVSEDIDAQKAINSSYETTFDYLLKHDKTGRVVKTTNERLASIAKGQPKGVLFDVNGRKITTREEALSKVAEFTKQKVLLEQENKTIEKQKGVLANGAGTPAPKGEDIEGDE